MLPKTLILENGGKLGILWQRSKGALAPVALSAAIALLLPLFSGVPVSGQNPGPVIDAALQRLDSILPPEGRIINSERTAATYSPDPLSDLADRAARTLGARVGTLQDHLVCLEERTLNRCRLENARSVAWLNVRKLDGDQAIVSLGATTQNGERLHSWFQEIEYLRTAAGEWRLARILMSGSS